MGWFLDHGICQLHFVGSTNQVIFVECSYIQVEPQNLGRVILPALCTWIVVHPDIIPLMYYQ